MEIQQSGRFFIELLSDVYGKVDRRRAFTWEQAQSPFFFFSIERQYD